MLFRSFEECRRHYRHPDKIVVTGTPVRGDFFDLTRAQAVEKNNIAQDYIDGMLKITSTPMLFVIVAGGLLGGLVGSIIGQKLLNKHFVKAGLVSVNN